MMRFLTFLQTTTRLYKRLAANHHYYEARYDGSESSLLERFKQTGNHYRWLFLQTKYGAFDAFLPVR